MKKNPHKSTQSWAFRETHAQLQSSSLRTQMVAVLPLWSLLCCGCGCCSLTCCWDRSGLRLRTGVRNIYTPALRTVIQHVTKWVLILLAWVKYGARTSFVSFHLIMWNASVCRLNGASNRNKTCPVDPCDWRSYVADQSSNMLQFESLVYGTSNCKKWTLIMSIQEAFSFYLNTCKNVDTGHVSEE